MMSHQKAIQDTSLLVRIVLENYAQGTHASMNDTDKVAKCSSGSHVLTKMLLNNSLRMSTSHLFTLSMTWVETKYQKLANKELSC